MFNNQKLKDMKNILGSKGATFMCICLISAISIIYLDSCSKSKSSNPALPVVTTAAVTEVTDSTAVSGGDVTDDGGSTITARGVCWKASPGATIADNKTTDASGTGIFTSNLANLLPNTTYYLKAYATSQAGTGYGTEKSFTTLQAGQTAHDVIIQNFAFNPSSLTVPVNTSVTWTNMDASAHTVTSDTGLFNSGDLVNHGSFTYKFTIAGTYAYHCSIHTYMTATITVQ